MVDGEQDISRLEMVCKTVQHFSYIYIYTLIYVYLCIKERNKSAELISVELGDVPIFLLFFCLFYKKKKGP